MIRTGGCVFSITRICTVLVWLRSSQLSPRPPRRPARRLGRGQIEILQRIAGRMLGRDVQGLEVVPLVFDLRARRPRVKPSRPMMSFSSSIVCVIGCRWPSRGRTPGTVGSNRRRSAVGPRRWASRSVAASKAASIACLTSLNRLPAAGLSALSTAPGPFARPSAGRSSRRGTRCARLPARRRRRQPRTRPSHLGPARPVRPGSQQEP